MTSQLSRSDILNRLKAVRASRRTLGRRFTARCPSHDRSEQPGRLAIAVADGRVLLQCRAGCAEMDILLALKVKRIDGGLYER